MASENVGMGIELDINLGALSGGVLSLTVATLPDDMEGYQVEYAAALSPALTKSLGGDITVDVGQKQIHITFHASDTRDQHAPMDRFHECKIKGPNDAEPERIFFGRLYIHESMIDFGSATT